jgi:signal transduction histidine kinase
MKINIRRKLATGFGICMIIMALLVACNIAALLRLESLYRETYRRSIEMEQATDAQHIGEDLSLVISNAIINRDLAKSEQEWATAKLVNRKKLDEIAGASDTPVEHKRIAEAETAFNDIIRIFETEMLPLVRQGSPVPGPLTEIDARVDAKIEDIERALKAVARCISADNAHASSEFHAVLAESIKVGLGFSLLGVLATLVISSLTTRWIVRPLAELTKAAGEMAQGNYLPELRYQSSDEAGVLAHAFRIMTAEVARRSSELQQANEQLNREVCERRLSQEEVSRLNAELEGRVAQRTTELVETNQQLESVIRAQHKTELELKRSRVELRGLSQHLQRAREAERTSIAREIHDDLGQTLTALKMDLAWIGKKLPEEQRQLLERTLEISRNIDQTISTVQRISSELRPGILDDLGLTAALEWQAQEFQKKTGIDFEVRSGFDCSTLSRHCATELFRIFQETLTNIYRHSGATQAMVTLEENEEVLVVTVTDNGRGVTEQDISGHQSLGFIGMRERVLGLGGTLHIKRIAEGGTCIEVIIPRDAGKEGVA